MPRQLALPSCAVALLSMLVSACVSANAPAPIPLAEVLPVAAQNVADDKAMAHAVGPDQLRGFLDS